MTARRFGPALVAIGAAISVGLYLVIGWGDRESTHNTNSNITEEPAVMEFSPTGTYSTGDSSMTLVLHAFEVTPDYISVVYTLAAGPGDTPQSFSPAIVDDKGQTYREIGNSILGSVDGVLAGLLVVESHIPGGFVLTIEASNVDMAGGESRSGLWSIPFLQARQPDAPITFIEGGRLSPEEGVAVNGSRVGIAGPPGSSPVEVLVHRSGKTTSLFGLVEGDGATRALSQQEFQAMFGESGYLKPPAFPTSAPAAP